MEVNKKQLSLIFDVNIRTIQNWQDQGMPVASGGGKGNEVLYNTAAVIGWHSDRDAAIENEKLRKEVDELRRAGESDLQPGSIDYERYRLTRAQADAQELKNARDKSLVMDTALFTFILQRIAGGISSRLDSTPMTLQRKYPHIHPEHIDAVKTEIALASNQAAAIHEELPRWIDEYNRIGDQ